ncbi:MAG: molybdopterin-dependent oxidoreductase [Nitrososphaerales archaeon]
MKNNILSSFAKGAFAGAVALGFLFVLRLGGIAPFPPESALEAFLKIVPAKVQETSVQQLGTFAGRLGLIVTTIISVAVYGALGILFEKRYAPRMSTRTFSRLEKHLIFSFIPFLFFGLVVLVSGYFVFGISSSFSTSSSVWLFPISLLIGNAIYGIALGWQYGDAVVFSKTKQSQTISRESVASSRRSFIERGSLALGALVLLATGINGLLTSQSSGTLNPSNLKGTPINTANEPTIFEDPRLSNLVNSEVTSNSEFYQVDIDIFAPSVDASTWTLQVGGLVQNPKTYTLPQLQNLPKTVEYNTFECVSNNVNGNLISNAEWEGLRLSDLFSDVGGISSGAEYVVCYSVDGYSVGIPVAKAMMQDSILAYTMNSSSLPQNHGFPLRAVIPGLYGMMSAKWIRKIQVVNTSYVGYWQTRGWSNDGTVQTLAFITVPSNGLTQSLSANNGIVMVGGYAYAGDRGISKVEVSTDGGKTWQEVVLKPPVSNDTWTLWAFGWPTTETGLVNVYARATDGTGAVQTSTYTGNFPSGATGYAAITVNVTK